MNQPRIRRDRQRGTGLIGSLAGFTAFLVLLLLAVQVIFDLYARSAVSAAALDAASRVARFEVATLPEGQLVQAESAAEDRARHLLGRYGARATFGWTITPADVVLRVVVDNPSIIPPALASPLGINTIDRTVRVHAERLVCADDQGCSS